MQHATSNHTVEYLGADRATGRCDSVVMVQLSQDEWFVGGGTYEDEYRRGEDGTWRIARRRVVRPFDLGPLTEMPQPEEEEDE